MSHAALAQTAICPPIHAHALFLAFDPAPGAEPRLARRALGRLGPLLDDWAAAGVAARNAWAVGVGSEHWAALGGLPAPRELAPFPQFADAIHPMPATPHAVFIHLRSERHDLCFAAGEAVRRALEGLFALAEAVPGFRFLDSRDLTGFVDGTENPSPEARPEVALVDDDGAFDGGSYLHVQRFVHDLPRWRTLTDAEQEAIVGRTKADDVELDEAVMPPTAHVARVVIEEDGEELEIVRQSLPYGTVGGEQGLMFLSYCKTPTRFTRMVERMNTRRDGYDDHLLRFTRAVSGAAYFVPPRAMLDAWAR
ncbi:Dyp-type peroxidase [Chitinimonas koreensis]|uniref:Dyp-type peroxidase n=2 Tax=Chitinimonas koreensis TaxID=356302 RepID=UPI0003F91D94|nr:Dyp-type peroxidase [Chitinimonas koreensis]